MSNQHGHHNPSQSPPFYLNSVGNHNLLANLANNAACLANSSPVFSSLNTTSATITPPHSTNHELFLSKSGAARDHPGHHYHHHQQHSRLKQPANSLAQKCRFTKKRGLLLDRWLRCCGLLSCSRGGSPCCGWPIRLLVSLLVTRVATVAATRGEVTVSASQT